MLQIRTADEARIHARLQRTVAQTLRHAVNQIIPALRRYDGKCANRRMLRALGQPEGATLYMDDRGLLCIRCKDATVPFDQGILRAAHEDIRIRPDTSEGLCLDAAATISALIAQCDALDAYATTYQAEADAWDILQEERAMLLEMIDIHNNKCSYAADVLRIYRR